MGQVPPKASHLASSSVWQDGVGTSQGEAGNWKEWPSWHLGNDICLCWIWILCPLNTIILSLTFCLYFQTSALFWIVSGYLWFITGSIPSLDWWKNQAGVTWESVVHVSHFSEETNHTQYKLTVCSLLQVLLVGWGWGSCTTPAVSEINICPSS